MKSELKSSQERCSDVSYVESLYQKLPCLSITDDQEQWVELKESIQITHQTFLRSAELGQVVVTDTLKVTETRRMRKDGSFAKTRILHQYL